MDKIQWIYQSAENLSEGFWNEDCPMEFKWAEDNGKRVLEAYTLPSMDNDLKEPELSAKFYHDGHPEYGDYRCLLQARMAFAIHGYCFQRAIIELMKHDSHTARTMALLDMDALYMMKHDNILKKFGIKETERGYMLDENWMPGVE